jgi:hypothetical protein
MNLSDTDTKVISFTALKARLLKAGKMAEARGE